MAEDIWHTGVRFRSLCKNCGAWVNHSALWIEINPKTNDCKQYVPSDNLEYLEWKYNKLNGFKISIY